MAPAFCSGRELLLQTASNTKLTKVSQYVKR